VFSCNKVGNRIYWLISDGPLNIVFFCCFSRYFSRLQKGIVEGRINVLVMTRMHTPLNDTTPAMKGALMLAYCHVQVGISIPTPYSLSTRSHIPSHRGLPPALLSSPQRPTHQPTTDTRGWGYTFYFHFFKIWI
jgi:hypothetical protein